MFRVGDLSLQGKSSEASVICLTCNKHKAKEENVTSRESVNESEDLDVVMTDDGPKPLSCEFNNIHLSPNFQFYVQDCLGPSVPFSR